MTTAAFDVQIADWARQHDVLSEIRYAVFVEEQGVPLALELDDLDRDPSAVVHVIANSVDGAAIGTARMLLEDGMVRVGRMAVLQTWRGQGVGMQMLDALCENAKQRRYSKVRLYAQMHAAQFYRKQGFAPVGEEFNEAGITHIEMRRTL